MKKMITIFMVGIMVFLLTACGSDFVGDWKAVSIDMAGHKVSDSEQAMIDEMLEDYKISVESDGKALFSRADKDETMDATWEANGNTITFKTSEEGEVTGELKDGRLVLDMDNAGKLTFEKR